MGEDILRFLEVVDENQAIFASGSYVAADGATVDLCATLDAAVASTTLLTEATLDALVAVKPRPFHRRGPRSSIGMSVQRSGACARALLDKGATRVAVLNYANGVTRGGGYLSGSRAQEEALCRLSELYPCLASDRPATRAFYETNRATGSALVTGAMLVSADVPFFRDEDLTLLAAAYPVTVSTAAAPDLGWLDRQIAAHEVAADVRRDLPKIIQRRVRAVFAAAHAAGCDGLVVGPWGCGAFGNDPDVVAGAFSVALNKWEDAFRHVVFSVFGPEPNARAFDRELALWIR